MFTLKYYSTNENKLQCYVTIRSHKPKVWARGAHSCPTPSRVLEDELRDYRVGRGWKNGRRDSRGAFTGLRSYSLHHGLYQEAFPWATGKTLCTGQLLHERPVAATRASLSKWWESIKSQSKSEGQDEPTGVCISAISVKTAESVGTWPDILQDQKKKKGTQA